MAKKIDPKAKAKKQKIYAAIGGVLLLGLLAFQVPRTMKMLNPPNLNEPSTATAPSTPSTTGAPIAAPTLSSGNVTAAVPTGGDGLSDPDAVPAAQSGQLLAFGLFRTKDPFAQQIDDSCVADADPSDGGATTCPSGGSGATGAGATGAGGPTGPSGKSGGKAGGKTPPPVAVVPTTAVISVNGASETVSVGVQFPASDPIFTLVSLTAKTAKVGIAGGSLENGSATVTLKKNKPVTLLNTADGTRYVLRLLSVG
jgi:hypothetical protein